MVKRYLIKVLFLIFTVVLTASCKKANNSAVESIRTEVIPDDIVEMRFDQISLAGIDTGSLEMRFLNNT